MDAVRETAQDPKNIDKHNRMRVPVRYYAAILATMHNAVLSTRSPNEAKKWGRLALLECAGNLSIQAKIQSAMDSGVSIDTQFIFNWGASPRTIDTT